MNNMAPRAEINPLLQLLILLGYAIGGAFIFTLLSLAIIGMVYGMDVLMKVAGGQINDSTIEAVKIVQAGSTLGIFLLPPILLAITEKTRINRFYSFKKMNGQLLLMVILLMVVSMPFMEWVVTINQQMQLPGALKSVENWMRNMEDEAMRQTLLLLKGTSVVTLLVNLVIVAILPGIAEELMFRGGIQRIFGKMFNNHHVAIWGSAILFSAIHMQFFGFFPRMYLGAAFGYIYYWSGSLWYAMMAHFLNNAYAVVTAWYLQKQNIPLDTVDKTMELPWFGYFISFILTGLMFVVIKNLTEKRNGRALG